MVSSIKTAVVLASSLLLPATLATSVSRSEGFLCPVPVIPADLGPSNACCKKLVEIPLSGLVNPEDGSVYWGIECTAAKVKEDVGDGKTQAITYPCDEGTSNGCCDPTFRVNLGSGPCTLPEQA